MSGPLHADRLAVHLEDPQHELTDHESPGRRYRWIRNPDVPGSLRIGVSDDTAATAELDDWKYYRNEVDTAFSYALKDGETVVSLLAPLTLAGSGSESPLCPKDLDEWSGGIAKVANQLLKAHAAVLEDAPARSVHVYATSKTSREPATIITQTSPSRDAMESLRYGVMADCFAGLTKQREGILKSMKAVSDDAPQSDAGFRQYHPSSVTVKQTLDAYRDSEDAQGGLEVDRAFAGFLESAIPYLKTVGKISEECLKNHKAFAREPVALARDDPAPAEDQSEVIKEAMKPVKIVSDAIENEKSGLKRIITQLALVQGWISKQESAQTLSTGPSTSSSRATVKNSATFLPARPDLTLQEELGNPDWEAEQAALLAQIEAEERQEEEHAIRLSELAAQKKAKKKARTEKKLANKRQEQEQRESEEAAARAKKQLEHQQRIAQLQAEAKAALEERTEREQLETARLEEEARERFEARSDHIKAKKAARKARRQAEQDAENARSALDDALHVSARQSPQDDQTASIATQQVDKSSYIPKYPWGDFEVDWDKTLTPRGGRPRSFPGSISDGDA